MIQGLSPEQLNNSVNHTSAGVSPRWVVLRPFLFFYNQFPCRSTDSSEGRQDDVVGAGRGRGDQSADFRGGGRRGPDQPDLSESPGVCQYEQWLPGAVWGPCGGDGD
jgi:hypothetical protein